MSQSHGNLTPSRRDSDRARRLIARAHDRKQKVSVTTHEVATRLAARKRQLIHGVFWMLAILLLHLMTERTPTAEVVKLMAYSDVQGWLGAGGQRANIVLIDIGHDFDEEGTGITNLANLQKLIDKIKNEHPVAIGIDIDFGYDEDRRQYVDPDEQVIHPCLMMTTSKASPTKCYVTVLRGLAKPPGDWLGSPAYVPIVVHPMRPADTLHGQKTMFGPWVHDKVRVPSLSGQLAADYLKASGRQSPTVPWLCDKITDQPETGLDLGPFNLNFGRMREIEADMKPVTKPEDIDMWKKRGLNLNRAIVIVGASNVAADSWVSPIDGASKPGMLLHAVATDTLTRAPVSEPGPLLQTILSIGTSMATLLVVFAIQGRYLLSSHPLHGDRLAVMAAIGAGLVTVAIAFGLAYFWGIMWTGFLLSSIFAAFHSQIEHWIVNLGNWIKRFFEGGFIAEERD